MHILSKMFIATYNNSLKCGGKKSKQIVVDYEKLEEALYNYVVNIFGYKFKENFTDYYSEISKSFENIVLNNQLSDMPLTIEGINEYGENFYNIINSYSYSSILINVLKEFYANGTAYPIVGNIGKSYYVMMISRTEEHVPTTYINDIESLDKTLKNFVENVLSSDTDFKCFFSGCEYKDAVAYLLKWVVQNASLTDLSDIENYFRKYSSFITDTTLNHFKRPIKIGKVLNDEVYVARKKANVNYETPYYLCFFINGENRKVELPNVRLGIETKGDTKIGHIIATQTAQVPYNYEMNKEYDKLLKQYLPKSKNFREFNPSHLVSLVLSFGLLKSLDINTIEVSDFMPLRYQRLITEGRKNDEELHDYQYRLTNKNLYNYFRLLEFQEGIEISNYPDGGFNLKLKLGDNIKFEDEFLQHLYNVAYQYGVQLDKENKPYNK